MRECKVGIIGFGFIGKAHAHGYLNLPLFYDPLPLKARVTRVCTAHASTAAQGKELIGADSATTDFRDITEARDIDIVHICSPNHLHKDALLSAMAHNKHIYCDKPLVAGMEEAEAVRAAMSGYRGTAQMTFQNRFFPATMRARQMVEDGFLGQPLEYRACYLHSGSANPDAPLKWKLSAESGGGVIADLASHIMDLMHALLGDFRAVMSLTHTAYAERPSPHDPGTKLPVDAEDCAMIMAEMCSGAVGTIEATKLASGTEDELRFEIHGSQGALRFNGTDPHHLQAYDCRRADKPVGGLRGWTVIDTGQRFPAPASGFPGPKFAIGWLRSHMACLANFLQDVADSKPGDPGLEQGLYVQQLMDCVRRSASERRWIQVQSSGKGQPSA
ncbi:Gfo/Idh/MocA family protein [Verrucomicrobiota bacterium]